MRMHTYSIVICSFIAFIEFCSLALARSFHAGRSSKVVKSKHTHIKKKGNYVYKSTFIKTYRRFLNDARFYMGPSQFGLYVYDSVISRWLFIRCIFIHVCGTCKVNSHDSRDCCESYTTVAVHMHSENSVFLFFIKVVCCCSKNTNKNGNKFPQ